MIKLRSKEHSHFLHCKMLCSDDGAIVGNKLREFKLYKDMKSFDCPTRFATVEAQRFKKDFHLGEQIKEELNK